MTGSGKCRLCLGPKGRKCIFASFCDMETDRLLCCDMIVALAAVTACKNDGLPNLICEQCAIDLQAAYQFKRRCEESYTVLMRELKAEDDIRIKEELESALPDDKSDDNQFDFQNDIVKCEERLQSDDSQADEHLKERKKKLKERRLKLKRVQNKNRKINEVLGLDVNTMKNERGDFDCNQCTRSFRCRRSFVRHLERHLGIKSFFCDICKKYFAREWAHMQTHLHPKVKSFLCEHCDKSFETRSSLNYHAKMHSDEKPHICDHCGKAFKRLDRLNVHKKIHSGIKDYICQFCSKDFMLQKNLLTHIKYKHTEERSYQCDRCEKRFVTSQCLKIHERRHLGIKNFHCEVCNKSFVAKSGLIAHRTMHTKEKPHQCRVCEAKFGRTDHRNRHELKSHGINVRIGSIKHSPSGED